MRARAFLAKLVVLVTAVPTAAAGRADIAARAAAAEQQKDYQGACRLYLAALADDPKNQALWSNLQKAADRLQQSMESAERQELDRFVHDAERRQARAYAAQEELRARAAKGRVLLGQDKIFEASDAFNRILEEAPGLDEARLGLQATQRALGSSLKRGRFTSPALLAATQGIHLYNQGQWIESASSLKQALSSSLPPEAAAGRLDYYAAKADLNHRAELWRIRRGELLAAARLAEENGKLKESEARLKEILAVDPADKEIQAELASLGAVTNVVKKAVREEARQKEIPRLLVKGTMFAAQQNYTDALTAFNDVLIIDPDNREAAEQIAEVKRLMKGQSLYAPAMVGKNGADAFYRQGLHHYGNERLEEARVAFEEALRLDRNHEGARQALQRLKNKS